AGALSRPRLESRAGSDRGGPRRRPGGTLQDALSGLLRTHSKLPADPAARGLGRRLCARNQIAQKHTFPTRTQYNKLKKMGFSRCDLSHFTAAGSCPKFAWIRSAKAGSCPKFAWIWSAKTEDASRQRYAVIWPLAVAAQLQLDNRASRPN